MHHIRLEVVQQTLVMGDDQSRSFRRAQFVETFGHDAQGIHIQSGIRLVEDAQLGFEHGHLEYLITLLLPAAEPFVDGTVGQLAVQFHDLSLLALIGSIP